MNHVTQTLVGPAPHIHARRSTPSLAWQTSLILAPAFIWGLYCFGLGALLPVAASIVAALVGEALVGLVMRRFTLGDGTAFLTGLLIGLAMPPSVPLAIPAVASLFAVCLVKGAFGGLGSNWMNPALAGIALALLAWPDALGTWALPHQLVGAAAGVSGVSGATPLAFVHGHAASGGISGSTLGILTDAGYHFSDFDKGFTALLNGGLFRLIGVELPSGYIDLLVGNKAGSIGELSGLLLLAGSIVLLAKKDIRWEIPFSIVASFALLFWIFGGLPFGTGYFSGDVLFELLSGSFILVTFYMATDPVTSPSSRGGMLLYGASIGLLAFALRSFGSRAEGIAFAVIIMNCLVPALAKLERPRRKLSKEPIHE